MLVCKKCAHEGDDWRIGLMAVSRGDCEVCGKAVDCIDAQWAKEMRVAASMGRPRDELAHAMARLAGGRA